MAQEPDPGRDLSLTTDAELEPQTLEMMEKNNIIRVVSGAIDLVDEWRVKAPDRVIPGAMLSVAQPAFSPEERREQDLVQGLPDPNDRRATRLALTESDEEKLRDAAKVHLASIRDHFVSRISDEEGAVISEIFRASHCRTRLRHSGAVGAHSSARLERIPDHYSRSSSAHPVNPQLAQQTARDAL